MSIDAETVDHVAQLARLALSPEERDRLRDQLSAILEHINLIAEADTSQVPETAHVLALTNVMVPDRSRPSDPREALLENAPEREAGYFRVGAVLEEE